MPVESYIKKNTFPKCYIILMEELFQVCQDFNIYLVSKDLLQLS